LPNGEKLAWLRLAAKEGVTSSLGIRMKISCTFWSGSDVGINSNGTHQREEMRRTGGGNKVEE